MSSMVLVSVRVRATPLRAFEAFTADIGLWWRPNGLFRFTPRSPGVMAFETGDGGRLIETLPNGNLRVTDKGWPVLDAVVADLAA